MLIINGSKILPFKLETTTDLLTPNAGLAIFGKFIHTTDIIVNATPNPQLFAVGWLRSKPDQ